MGLVFKDSPVLLEISMTALVRSNHTYRHVFRSITCLPYYSVWENIIFGALIPSALQSQPDSDKLERPTNHIISNLTLLENEVLIIPGILALGSGRQASTLLDSSSAFCWHSTRLLVCLFFFGFRFSCNFLVVLAKVSIMDNIYCSTYNVEY